MQSIDLELFTVRVAIPESCARVLYSVVDSSELLDYRRVMSVPEPLRRSWEPR